MDNGWSSRVKFIGAVTASTFPLCDVFHGRVSIPGQRDGFYRDTGHLLINYYDPTPALGRKHVLTNNACTRCSHRRCMAVVPVYDDYRILLDKCDIFKRRLCHSA